MAAGVISRADPPPENARTFPSSLARRSQAARRPHRRRVEREDGAVATEAMRPDVPGDECEHSFDHEVAAPRVVDERIERAARSHCTLLLTGETGVGKGYMAKSLHRISPRRDCPFIPVNCGAIPESLLDSQLFPHNVSWMDRSHQVASLDHAMWFHRPFRADQWLLYDQQSPAAAGARGFSTGRLFTRDGALVVSVAQEGLIRPLRGA